MLKYAMHKETNLHGSSKFKIEKENDLKRKQGLSKLS